MRFWHEMEVFRGIDLADSFVRSWAHEGTTVWFELLFILTIDHQFYRPPELGGSSSLKAGKLVFADAMKVEGLLPMQMVEPLVTSGGYYDFGTVETMKEEARGVYKLSGDFGAATIHSAEPTIVYGMIGV